jgi:diguanylate cyclase (GGDEF)-like protein
MNKNTKNEVGFVEIIDGFFTDAVLSDFSEDERVRARIIFSVLSFSAVGLAISSFVMLCLSLLMVRNLWIGVLFSVVVSIGMGLTAYFFRINGRILITANIFSVLMFVSIGTAFLVTGGIHSPVAFLLLAVPVMIFMVAGRKSGLLWSLVVLMFYLAVFYLDRKGISFVQIMREQNRELVTTSLWYLSAVIIIGFLAIYERIVGGLTVAIHDEKSRFHDGAIYDALTGFLNRESFQQTFEEALHEVSSSGGRLALLRIDIKNLKQVVSQLGYDVGDELVRQLSGLCRQAVASEGVLGRFGSGEFCILLPKVRDRGQVISLVSRLKRDFGNHIEISEGIKLPVRIGMGGVFAPDFSISSRSLLRGVQDALVECDALRENFVLR